MPVTYDSITSTTITSATTTLILSNIPQTYTDFIVVINWVAAGSGYPTVKITMNNDGPYTYYGTQFHSGTHGGNAQTNRNTNAGFISAPRATGIPDAANETVAMRYEFLNYTNTNMLRTMYYSTGGGESGIEVGTGGILSTAALTQLKFDFGVAEWGVGTVISTYGILRA